MINPLPGFAFLISTFISVTLAAQDAAPPPPAADEPQSPYPRRFAVPDFPADTEWLNVSKPPKKSDLRGRFVLLDFWTYCCINCIHTLPELKKLERAYPNELLVIGVHSAKFEAEKGTKNIEEAILRYEIEHPVINDDQHTLWNMFGVRSWPTVLLIDPEGYAVWGKGGEAQFEEVQKVIELGLNHYRDRGVLSDAPLDFELLADRAAVTPLRFPGKVFADERSERLFIADSNHNRIVVTSLTGELQEVIGSGEVGRRDGSYEEASFNHPQGMALRGDLLYVADTENHLLRSIDLSRKQVQTIAGTGVQNRRPWPGLDDRKPGDPFPDRWAGTPNKTALSSPWALWIDDQDIYIAMAGPHQIWKMTLDGAEISIFAGNGREDIVDGPLVPPVPYQEGFASFAQPSGLTSDGEWLFVADSEGSSIRAVPFDPQQQVRTVVGTNSLPQGRLFKFGDRDGRREQVLLQHALGVTWNDGKIYATDTYNNKIKMIEVATGTTETLAGTGKPGLADAPPQFDEPAGISYAAGKLYIADTNNHAIRVLDLATGAVTQLVIKGLQPPGK